MHHAPAVSPNDKLRLAASKGQTAKVLELIEGGATCDADRQGRTALHFSSHYGFSDTVAALILTGCDVNAPDFSGHTALQRAAAEGHVAIVQHLVKHGARIDHQDDIHGNTALHESAWKGYSQTIEALCKAKANIYIKNKGGFAPLHLACQNGHNQSCRVLLTSGCRPDIKNNYGDTPLHTAARYGHAGVIRILISANCNVSEQNKNDDTALHISSAMGRRKLTRILLEAGCDQSLENKQGEKASDIAKRKEFGEVMEILQNPPPRRLPSGSGNNERLPEVSKKSHKKRDKESGTSKDSKDSGSRHKSKHKNKKSKHGHRVHFKQGSKGHREPLSPYGCHHSSKMMSSFPTTNLDSLPKEPLKKGEQYYLDLAGNIRKGPVGVGYACYCAPFFQHVEQKMENDKQELMEHIDLAHDDLNAKISNLERRTRAQLQTINQGVKERLAGDKAECLEKVERASMRERAGRERLKDELKTWLRMHVKDVRGRQKDEATQRLGGDCESTDDSEDDSEEDDDEEDEDEDAVQLDSDRFLKAFRRSNVQSRRRSGRSRMAAERLSRSKSEEVISERNYLDGDGVDKLRVLGRRSGGFGRSHDDHLCGSAMKELDKENDEQLFHVARVTPIDWQPPVTSAVHDARNMVSGAVAGRPYPEPGTARLQPECATTRLHPECGTARLLPECGTARLLPECGTARLLPECGTARLLPECGTARLLPECGTARLHTECGAARLQLEYGTAPNDMRRPSVSPQQASHYQNLAALHATAFTAAAMHGSRAGSVEPAVPHDSQDHDSGYTTKLHSSFDSQSSPRPPSSNGMVPPVNLRQRRLQMFAAEFGDPSEPEFVAMNRQFLDTVSHETDKWYERRMLSFERRTTVDSVVAEGSETAAPLSERYRDEVQEAVRERTVYSPVKMQGRTAAPQDVNAALSKSGNSSSLV